MILVYTTVTTLEEAKSIAKALLAERLIACANIHTPLYSLYSWQGKIVEDKEIALFLKTRAELWPQLESRLKSLHTYDCPAILALPITNCSPEYQKWLYEATQLA